MLFKFHMILVRVYKIQVGTLYYSDEDVYSLKTGQLGYLFTHVNMGWHMVHVHLSPFSFCS